VDRVRSVEASAAREHKAAPLSRTPEFDEASEQVETHPVATVAANNPALSTLVTAVKKARPGRHAQLTTNLTYHVVADRLRARAPSPAGARRQPT
jgi:uncharacterized surface protein with fasciclin (FAS1) repeats